MLSAIAFAIKWYRRQWYELIVNQQNDIGPLVADLKSLTMIKTFDIIAMKAKTMLDSTVAVSNGILWLFLQNFYDFFVNDRSGNKFY